MPRFTQLSRLLGVLVLFLPILAWAEVPVKTMVIFGDSLSDTGNTAHLLRSLRKEDNPAYLVRPAKVFVINKMTEFARENGVPQVVLKQGIALATQFFDTQAGPLLASIISSFQQVPELPGDPYWQDHFSNGRVWTEYLAPMISVDREDRRYFVNKAFAGSWAVTFDHQLNAWNLIRYPILSIQNLIVGKLIPPSLGLIIQAYLIENKVFDDDTVYFVFIGGNDYLNALNFGDNYDSMQLNNYIDNVLNNLSSSVNKLIGSGAKHLVILGVPDVGYAPKFVNTSKREILNMMSQRHNELLLERMIEWQAQYPDIDFLYVDIQPILKKALENPPLFGFKNVTEACIDVKFPLLHRLIGSPFENNFVLAYAERLNSPDNNLAFDEPNYQVCAHPEDYLFWDEVHPTTKAHLFLADEICLIMKAHGYKATCAKLIDG